jgi:hypothetical protein
MSDQQDFSTNLGGLSDEDRQIERLLASMVPRESRVSRDRVMYLAGQASAPASNPPVHRRFSRWIWPASTACAACAGLVIGVLLSARNSTSDNSVAIEQREAHKPPMISAEGTKSSNSPQVADAAAVESQTGFLPASMDPRIAVDLHATVAKGFPLLALRDRMLANHGDDTALAQVDSPTGSEDSATDVERPLGARVLFEHWIANEGPAAR